MKERVFSLISEQFNIDEEDLDLDTSFRMI